MRTSYEEQLIAHKKIRARIDQLAHIQMCHVFEESYPNIHVVNTDTSPMCTRRRKEGSCHRFLAQNRMDPGSQPRVLADLTQVEEMLVEGVSPILQVMHSVGDQFKYRGHTIGFPQEIKSIANILPRQIRDLNVLIVVRKKGGKGTSYDFTIRKENVYNALIYKVQHGLFYRDVRIDYRALDELPDNNNDVTQMISTITLPDLQMRKKWKVNCLFHLEQGLCSLMLT